MKLGLANIERLLSALGNPHHEFAAVQIAGTNGKGSTAVVLDSICSAAKIERGLYTSPHLISITERIRINGEQISPADFARFTGIVKVTAEQLVAGGQLESRPTFFEHLTAIALLAFREAGVKLAILETGLGGRLDATTAVAAGVVGLTSIAEDHQEYLGETIAEIAAEKAAIIHTGSDVVVGPQVPDALRVIMRRCDTVGVKPTLVDGAAEILGASADGRVRANFKTTRANYSNVQLGLRGRHQVANVSVAIALAEALNARGFPISREAIIKGVKAAAHAGRLELQEGPPRILFDGAHNPAAARALRDFLELVTAPVTLVFGAMRDKGLKEMLEILTPLAANIVLTTFGNARAASLEMLSAAVPGGLPVENITQADSVDAAMREALARTDPDGMICVTGSLYLVGEVKSFLST